MLFRYFAVISLLLCGVLPSAQAAPLADVDPVGGGTSFMGSGSASLSLPTELFPGLIVPGTLFASGTTMEDFSFTITGSYEAGIGLVSTENPAPGTTSQPGSLSLLDDATALITGTLADSSLEAGRLDLLFQVDGGSLPVPSSLLQVSLTDSSINMSGFTASTAQVAFTEVASASIPLPGTVILFGAALLGLGIARRFRNRI